MHHSTYSKHEQNSAASMPATALIPMVSSCCSIAALSGWQKGPPCQNPFGSLNNFEQLAKVRSAEHREYCSLVGWDKPVDC